MRSSLVAGRKATNLHLPNIAHIQQYGAIIKDCLTGIAALVGAIAAYRGVIAWHIQLVGNSNYDVGRQVLRAVSKLRNAIEVYRSRAVFGYEEKDRKDQENLYQVLFRYRGKFLNEALSDLNTAQVEAEAIWGPRSREVIDPLSRKAMNLIISSNLLIELPQDDPIWREINQSVLGEFTDRFGVEFAGLEALVVKYVRRKMGISK